MLAKTNAAPEKILIAFDLAKRRAAFNKRATNSDRLTG